MGWIFGGVLLLILLGVFLVPLALFGLGLHWAFGWPYGVPFFFFPFGFFIVIFVLFAAFRFLFWGSGWGRWRRGWGYGYYGGYGYSDALEILNQRYARGEITKEQYEQMKADIQKKPV